MRFEFGFGGGKNYPRPVSLPCLLTKQCEKYARMCIQVYLTKPLLAMFSIKVLHYKVEYKGLHLLCLSCGRFGHFAEGYGERKSNMVVEESNKDKVEI